MNIIHTQRPQHTVSYILQWIFTIEYCNITLQYIQSVAYGGWGGGFKPLPEISKFWQSRAEFPVLPLTSRKFDKSNQIANWAEPLTRRLPLPEPHSLCSLTSTEFVEPPPTPQKKIPGYTTAYSTYKPTMTMIVAHLRKLSKVNNGFLTVFYYQQSFFFSHLSVTNDHTKTCNAFLDWTPNIVTLTICPR
jgi:hypothetical protein